MMLLFALLAIIAVIMIVFMLMMFSAIGAGAILLFGDVIVCIAIIVYIMLFIWRHRR